MVRRSLEAVPEIKYYLSNGKQETPLGVMARLACTRHTIEDYMTLVALAHLFVTLTRLHLKKTPEMILDRTVRLLRSAFKLPTLTTETAIRLV